MLAPGVVVVLVIVLGTAPVVNSFSVVVLSPLGVAAEAAALLAAAVPAIGGGAGTATCAPTSVDPVKP